MDFVNNEGVRLHYEIFGEQGPWLALVSGGRRSGAEFVPLARRISALGFRVVLHDRRNTGASQVLIEGERGEEDIWADDWVQLMQHLNAVPAFFGGGSSGARLALLTSSRHSDAVRGLLLLRITGGAFTAGRLPENYYGQFIRAAEQGGMAAVCATPYYQELIAADPSNQDRLMAMDPQQYMAVMRHWLQIFLQGPREPVLGMTIEALQAIRVPTWVVPGNDKTHVSRHGREAAALIPGCELFELPVADEDVPALPFSAWGPHEETLATAMTDFMRRVAHDAH
ncbi:alpha/beta fold hydrolase [Limnohabitans sp. 2KL-3]|uniref:alpha/beta fold hydrolase n=1 Tax=Limnohabitans sp. 2KL-3 TaxID=1100700 RepID=UPI000A57778B|nr:alpha/beta hydrolase [Limnohabitans sp. 2KL-3]